MGYFAQKKCQIRNNPWADRVTAMSTTIHAMNIFARAVETNSFIGVARSLFIDPGAVSRTIKSLETELGVLLFARSTRSLKLTPEGARFYRDCVQILKRFQEATGQFRTNEATQYGRLRVGLSPGMSRRMLLREIPAFAQQYPGIEIVLVSIDEFAEIDEKGVDVLLRGVSRRKRDAIRPHPPGVVVRRLIQSPFIACASPKYLDRAGAPRAPADLLRHTCAAHINLERDIRSEWTFVKLHLQQKVKLVPKLLVQGAEALIEAGVASYGVIRVAACDVEDELRSRELVQVLPDWECAGMSRRVAIYRKTQPMPPQVGVFVRHLTEVFRRYNVH
jgi:LysR family transcriptional regulator for bpeEF and oprC